MLYYISATCGYLLLKKNLLENIQLSNKLLETCYCYYDSHSGGMHAQPFCYYVQQRDHDSWSLFPT